MAADWLIRTYTPTWLRLADLTPEAESLERLPRLETWGEVESVGPVVQQVQSGTSAAWSDAYGNDGLGVGVTTWYAARNAAWAAARGSTGEAALNVALNVQNENWSSSNVVDVASDAARDAAQVAAYSPKNVEPLAREALCPTVENLQDAAIGLFTRMVRVGADEAP